ncbi:MAG: hypothetical protein L0Y66_04085 [Myxococcaceae bacterium]|nr:hypothetical protein [Myxococcaceae bacterium]
MPPEVQSPRISDSEATREECEALEADVAALKAAYDQYFLGIERLPPAKKHEALKKRLGKLKGAFIKSTAVRFRVNGLHARFITYERLWEKSLQARENGTDRRDLMRVRRKKERRDEVQKAAPARGPVELLEPDVDLELDDMDTLLGSLTERMTPAPLPPSPLQSPASPLRPTSPLPLGEGRGEGDVAKLRPPVPATRPTAVPPPLSAAPAPGRAVPPPLRTSPARAPTPPSAALPRPAALTAAPAMPTAAAAPRPPAAPAASGVSDAKLRAVYDAYVSARRRCNEDTASVNYEQVSGQLRRQMADLQRTGAKNVEFKVVIKDGKTELRTVPKD